MRFHPKILLEGDDRTWPFEVPPADFVSTFIADRNAVRTQAQLRAFVRKYRRLWEAARLPVTERAILSGTLPKRLLRRFQEVRNPDLKRCDNKSRLTRVALHLVLPYIFVHAMMKSQEYGTPLGIVIEQLFGVYPPNPYAGFEDTP